MKIQDMGSQDMGIQHLDRIRFVTRHFHDLQGLRTLVPAGLLTLSAGAVTGVTNPVLLSLQALSFLAAVLLVARAGRYYSAAFGEVEAPAERPVVAPYALSIFSPAGSTAWLDSSPQAIPLRRRLPMILMMAPAAFLLFQLLFWPPWIKLDSIVIFDAYDSFLPTAPTAFEAFSSPLIAGLGGSFLLCLWLLRQRRLSQIHHLVLGTLLLGLATQTAHTWVMLLLCGSALALAGLLDHRQLVRALGGHQ
jgi:hypothetical protein